MNDREPLERFVADRFDDIGPGRQMPDPFQTELLVRVRGTRQRPRWLALIKEPPMRISSSLAVGSPMARVAAIAVATLLLASLVAGAGIAGGRLLAADDAIVVDPSGDTTSIGEAVAAAADGDTIIVKAGTYDESIEITKDVTIRGEGDRAAVVIENSTELASGISDIDTELPFAFRFEGATATLENLTLRGESARIDVSGGALVLSGVHLDGTGRVFGVDTGSSVPTGLDIEDGASVTVEDSVLDDAAIDVESGSSATIFKSAFSGGYVWAQGTGVVVDIVENTFTEAPRWAVSMQGGATARIGANEFHGGRLGVDIQDAGFGIPDSGTVANIMRNRFFGTGAGISAGRGTTVDIADNRFEDVSGVAIAVTEPATAVVRSNTVDGGGSGIRVGGELDVDSNTVTGAGRGLEISSGSPVLVLNDVCRNDANLVVLGSATPDIRPSNEICPDAAE